MRLLRHFLLLLVVLGVLGCTQPAAPGPGLPWPDDDDSATDDDDSATDDDDSATDDDDSADPPEPEPLVWPELPHLDEVVDLARGSTPVWASLFSVQEDAHGEPAFASYDYDGTAHSLDFWPASTIKIYTATAALVLLEDYGLTLDAEATFSRRDDPSDSWTEDITVSFREMIFDVFDHSSNPDYTLLLRFAGVDWLSTEFFVPQLGFEETALLVDYTSDRPWAYELDEEQRIVLTEGAVELERTHLWSGTPYDDLVECGFRYGTRANCSSPSDMAEHMRRLVFHEYLAADEQFALDPDTLEWMRYGDTEGGVMSQPSSAWAEGIQQVFPDATYLHKAGQVGSFALDLHYVDDVETDTRFVGAVVTEAPSSAVYKKVSEELTRMLRTPQTYLHLDYLADHVNPVTADLWVYTEVPGRLELVVKDDADDGHDPEGWTVLPGTELVLELGEAWHGLTSDCLEIDGQHHVRGRFTPDDPALLASTSDLHYVIVDGDLPCD